MEDSCKSVANSLDIVYGSFAPSTEDIPSDNSVDEMLL